MQRTHYDNLHISKQASPEVVRAAYKVLAQKWHPDKNPNQQEKSERYFKIIRVAYEILSDPKSRAEYDAFLQASDETIKPAWKSDKKSNTNQNTEKKPNENHSSRPSRLKAKVWSISKQIFIAILLFFVITAVRSFINISSGTSVEQKNQQTHSTAKGDIFRPAEKKPFHFYESGPALNK